MPTAISSMNLHGSLGRLSPGAVSELGQPRSKEPVGSDQKQGCRAEKPGFSGGDAGARGDGLKKQRLLRETGREMVQERGLVPSSFLQTGARLRTPTKGVILHSSQEGLSGLPGRHAHHTQCHSACPDSLSGVCHTKGDFITR